MFRIIGIALFLLMGVTGCLRLADGTPPGPLYMAYEAIDDPASDAFVEHALVRLQAEFGNPAIPVNQVILRRSKKVDEVWRYRLAEDFSLTECADASQGIFVIYLAVNPSHPNYFPLLAHECAHLLNPYLFDWYMEGMATVFSEKICGELDKTWGNWKHRFEHARREPYALSYRMMLELQQEFPRAYVKIPHFTAQSGSQLNRKQINIDAWLETLPPLRQNVAREIIARYTKALKKSVSEQCNFSSPSPLSDLP